MLCVVIGCRNPGRAGLALENRSVEAAVMVQFWKD